jgi:hypothetical protein
MLFDDIKVSAELLKAGGLETVLADKTTAQVQNYQRLICLEQIKNDLKIALGLSAIDYDFIATNYDYLIIEALRLLQRYQIIVINGDNFDGSNTQELADFHIKEYEKMKKNFASINLNTVNKITSISVTDNYR